MKLPLHFAGALDPVKLCQVIGLEPDPWQLDVLRARDQRLCLNVHRQGGKSTVAAVLAVHEALYTPGCLVLMVSPSQRQSQELFRRALVLYRALGRPVAPEAENALSLTLESGSRIVSLPGDEKTIRGYSNVALLIVDEAARVEDELMAAVSPMLAVSRGRMVAMSTPWGKRGFYYDASRSNDWRTVTVPATMCPRLTAEVLEKERRTLGELVFRSEYMAEFVDAFGRAFSSDDISAIFASGELGLVGPGALFYGLPGEQPKPQIIDVPQRLARITRCTGQGSFDGHHAFPPDGGDCMLGCGSTRPAQPITRGV